MCTDSVSDITQAEHLINAKDDAMSEGNKVEMTEQSEKERQTTSIALPTTVGKNASWMEPVAHRASRIKKTQAHASLRLPNTTANHGHAITVRQDGESTAQEKGAS